MLLTNNHVLFRTLLIRYTIMLLMNHLNRPKFGESFGGRGLLRIENLCKFYIWLELKNGLQKYVTQ
jgi:hypothetical protein